jgi:hypothetical protein
LSQENVTTTGVRLGLGWRTRGPGDTDGWQVASLSLVQGALKANQIVQQPFNLKLPSQPWSYTGQHVSIIWYVWATIDIPLTADSKAQAFILAPRL